MFKADLDRLYHEEQIRDYLRQGQRHAAASQARRCGVRISGYAAVACIAIGAFAYWIGAVIAASAR